MINFVLITIILVLMPMPITISHVNAGGPRLDYDERYEDVQGAPECWVDGYDAGFAVNSTYHSLKRAWTGFRIAYREGNQEKMNYYLEGIQKFEKQLGHPVSSLSDILKVVQQQSAITRKVVGKNIK